MNKEKFESNWKELKGHIKEKWGKLTDSDITQINGKYDQFLGALQKRYSYDKARAEKEVNSWNCADNKSCKSHPDRDTRNQFERNQDSSHRCERDTKERPAHRADDEKKRKAG